MTQIVEVSVHVLNQASYVYETVYLTLRSEDVKTVSFRDMKDGPTPFRIFFPEETAEYFARLDLIQNGLDADTAEILAAMISEAYQDHVKEVKEQHDSIRNN